jgi:kynurenine 3-monooxygenase
MTKLLSASTPPTPNALALPKEPTHVVVAGAGPSGILLSLLLLKRNEEGGCQYKVTLVESRSDLGLLDPATDLKLHRSWMIGLQGHGLEALREIPELYNDYINGVGMRLQSISIHLGRTEMKSSVGQEGEDNEGYVVDRNFIVAALARYMKDKHANNPLCVTKYDTKLLYVDMDEKRVLTRSKEGKDEYLNYDLLVGADGLRSVVREALVKHHIDFEMDIGDIFQTFKSVHVKRPANVDPASLHLLPSALPLMQGIALPETGDLLNISFGVPRHVFDKLAEEIKTDDPIVFSKYLRQHFKAFQLDDYDDFAKQFVASRWNRTGMVHCNLYHSSELKIIIMGDAAHATSPSIGMGMNTALRDAQVLCRILGETNDDLDKALPKYSKERVKEGNSLTDLSFHSYCLSERAQLVESLHMVIRSKLHGLLPWLVEKHPQAVIGLPKWSLTDVYKLAKRQGIIDKHRLMNNQIRQSFFESEVGMAETETKRYSTTFKLCAMALLSVAVTGYSYVTKGGADAFNS